MLSNGCSRDEAKDYTLGFTIVPEPVGLPGAGQAALQWGRASEKILDYSKAKLLIFFPHLSKPEVYDTRPLATGL